VFANGVAVTGLLRRYLRVPVLPVKGYSVTANIADTSGPTHAVIDEASKLAIARLGSRARLAGMAEIVGHDRSVNLERCQQLVGQYEALYGSLPDIERSYWSGLRPMTPDGTPIIGATAIQGLYLNTGHGAYGWTLSCGSARLLADQLAGRASPLNAKDYALDPAVLA
jgi:D-amino-acid dehydrogenase